MPANYEVTKEAVIPGLGTILYINAPFDAEVRALRKAKAPWITARQLAEARIKTPDPNHSIWQNGSWIKEGVLYKGFFTKNKTAK